METRGEGRGTSDAEVSMVEPEVVRQMRGLAAQGWGPSGSPGSWRSGAQHGAPLPARRGGGGGPGAASALGGSSRRRAGAARLSCSTTTAEGNAVVVADLLARGGRRRRASARCSGLCRPRRRERDVAEVATVRFETEPGHQMQIDFGEKWVRIAGQRVKVYLLVAVLGYSRRIFVKAFLSERQDDWREGIAAAFRHFGGVPQAVLVRQRPGAGDSSRRPGTRSGAGSIRRSCVLPRLGA